MAIAATREGDSFTVKDTDALVEVAQAMAELNRRWGHRGDISSLTADFDKIIATARYDSKMTTEEVLTLEQKSQKIQLLEELARSFRETMDEPDPRRPTFHGSLAEGRDTAVSYARVVGAKLEFIS